MKGGGEVGSVVQALAEHVGGRRLILSPEKEKEAVGVLLT